MRNYYLIGGMEIVIDMEKKEVGTKSNVAEICKFAVRFLEKKNVLDSFIECVNIRHEEKMQNKSELVKFIIHYYISNGYYYLPLINPISGLFVWSETKYGYDYWRNLSNDFVKLSHYMFNIKDVD